MSRSKHGGVAVSKNRLCRHHRWSRRLEVSPTTGEGNIQMTMAEALDTRALYVVTTNYHIW